MTDIRNDDGRLVCRLDEKTGAIEIKVRDCTTLIRRSNDGKPIIIHQKN